MSTSAEGREDTPAELSLVGMLIVLGVSLAVFAGLHPIWRADVDVDAWNRNIFWSYVPIPLLVVALLVKEGKLGLSSFALETTKISLLKFGITYVLAHTLWTAQGAPEAVVTEVPTGEARTTLDLEPGPAPVATELDPARTGRLAVQVRDVTGRPVTGALVWITDGLQDVVFAPPEELVVLENAGGGFQPELAVLHAFQVVELLSGDGQLHTAVFSSVQGRHELNYPILADGRREVMFRRGRGLMDLVCSVHRTSEAATRVLVTENPFASRTDGEGRVVFDAVPHASLRVAAWWDGIPEPVEEPVDFTSDSDLLLAAPS